MLNSLHGQFLRDPKMSITFYKGKDKLYKYAFTENISKDKSIATDQGKEKKFHFHYG